MDQKRTTYAIEPPRRSDRTALYHLTKTTGLSVVRRSSRSLARSFDAESIVLHVISKSFLFIAVARTIAMARLANEFDDLFARNISCTIGSVIGSVGWTIHDP